MSLWREPCDMCTLSRTTSPSCYGSLVRHQVLRDVTQHVNRPFGNLSGFEHRRVIHQKTQFSGEALSYWPYVMNALYSCAEVLTSAVLCLIKARGCTCSSASIQSACVFVLLRLQHATLYLACAIAPCCIAPCCIAVFHAIIIYSCSCYLKGSRKLSSY